MFDKLRKAFTSAAKSIGQKEISARILDDALLELQIALLESDVAQEVVDSLSAALKKDLLGMKLEKGQVAELVIQSRFKQAVAEIFARAGRFDVVNKIRAKKNSKAGPYSIVFLGINGTGKTTTVAKVANMFKKSGFTVVVAAGDTHRAGAIEQLTQHCERLSIKVIAQRYGADPSAVGRDAIEYGRKHHVDIVLVDTAGRMQTSKNLMDEMSKIVRVVKPDAKLFIGDSLAGNDTINQAREFFQYTNFDGAILTKVDADAKGGSAISIAYITSKPICYIGVGQDYDDIIPFDPDNFIQTLFGTSAEVTVESLMSKPRVERDKIGAPGGSKERNEVDTEQKIPVLTPQVASGRTSEKDNAGSNPELSESNAPLPNDSVVPIEKSTAHLPGLSKPSTSANTPSPLNFQDRNQDRQPEVSKPAEPLVAADLPPSNLTEKGPNGDAVKPEKKNRFGFFGKRSKPDDEQERMNAEARQQAQIKAQKEELKPREMDEKKKRKEDKDNAGQKDEVIYLTDEDIEDLLK